METSFLKIIVSWGMKKEKNMWSWLLKHFFKNFITDCSLFTPKFTQDYDGRILNVTFSKGPDICNYQKYEIGVYNNENKKRITRMIVPTQVSSFDIYQNHTSSIRMISQFWMI